MKRAFISMPAGFEYRREGTGLFATRGDECFIVAPMRRELWKGTLDQIRSLADASLEEVTFGASKGFRISRLGRVTSYMLRVDGKHVALNLNCASALVEPLIHTLAFRSEEI